LSNTFDPSDFFAELPAELAQLLQDSENGFFSNEFEHTNPINDHETALKKQKLFSRRAHQLV
jgi:DNA replication initiation complex subunit (GINS family)